MVKILSDARLAAADARFTTTLNQFTVSEQTEVNVHGETLLHLAVGFGYGIGVIKKLVSEGVDVYAKNNSGMTPLDMANEVGYKAAIEYLSSVSSL